MRRTFLFRRWTDRMNRRRAIAALLSTTLVPTPALARSFDETFRPQVHFSPARNWINDPNGLIYHKGRYHLFFQHNPFGADWGHMSWGHAVSSDLFHWRELPVAIPEGPDAMIFSGSIVADTANTSGFGSAKNPPLVAIYTAHDPKTEIQAQHIAYSLDDGLTWTKYSGNPVIALAMKDFRDPKVIRFEDHWLMVVTRSAERKVVFYRSGDLKHWTETGAFGPAGTVDGVWECPDLMRFGARWVLKVDSSPARAGSGCGGQVFIGTFDGKTFTSEAHQLLDIGEDYYASASWAGLPAGRAIAIAWMAAPRYAGHQPTSPWRGSMSIPRELSLKGTHLYQTPVRELAGLEINRREVKPGTLFNATAHGPARRLRLKGSVFTLEIRDRNGAVLTIASDGQRLSVARFAPAIPSFVAENVVPLAVTDCDIIIDRASVEAFANGGERTISALMFPDGGGYQAILTGAVTGVLSDLKPIRT
jgi:fructan beta-fructosidase